MKFWKFVDNPFNQFHLLLSRSFLPGLVSTPLHTWKFLNDQQQVNYIYSLIHGIWQKNGYPDNETSRLETLFWNCLDQIFIQYFWKLLFLKWILIYFYGSIRNIAWLLTQIKLKNQPSSYIRSLYITMFTIANYFKVKKGMKMLTSDL